MMTSSRGSINLDEMLKAVAHPVRWRILDLLAEGERPVHLLAEEFQISRSAVSQHLKILLDAGLVVDRRVGRERHYQLSLQARDRLTDPLRHLNGPRERKVRSRHASTREEATHRSNYTDVIVGPRGIEPRLTG